MEVSTQLGPLFVSCLSSVHPPPPHWYPNQPENWEQGQYWLNILNRKGFLKKVSYWPFSAHHRVACCGELDGRSGCDRSRTHHTPHVPHHPREQQESGTVSLESSDDPMEGHQRAARRCYRGNRSAAAYSLVNSIKDATGCGRHGIRQVQIQSRLIPHVSSKAAEEDGQEEPVRGDIMRQKGQQLVYQSKGLTVPHVRKGPRAKNILPWAFLVADSQLCLQLLVQIINLSSPNALSQLPHYQGNRGRKLGKAMIKLGEAVHDASAAEDWVRLGDPYKSDPAPRNPPTWPPHGRLRRWQQ